MKFSSLGKKLPSLGRSIDDWQTADGARSRGGGGDGEAVRLLHRLGRLYAAGIRAVTMPWVGVIALLAVPAQMVAITVVVVVIVAGWSVMYVRRLLRGPVRWVTVVDAAVLIMLCLSSRWMVPSDWLAGGESWVMAFVSFAIVAYQVHTSLMVGLPLTLAVWAALVVGSVSAAPPGSSIDIMISTIWTLVAPALSRLLWILVRRGGRIADRLTTEAAHARTAQRVADAVRADEDALANALHDTAASTLLMVGIGEIRHTDGQLTAQAQRDLAVLATYGQRRPARLELTGLLRATINLVPLRVDFHTAGEVVLPSPVATAMAEATGETLTNVVRHAGVDHVVVRVRGDARQVRVEVVDHGRGFDPYQVPATRRGLRESIHGRMNTIGGRVVVHSGLGSGTRVQLEWSEVPTGDPNA